MSWVGKKVLVRNQHNEFFTVGEVVQHGELTGVVGVLFQNGESQLRPVGDIQFISTNPCHCFCHECIPGVNHASRCVCNGGWGYL